MKGVPISFSLMQQESYQLFLMSDAAVRQNNRGFTSIARAQSTLFERMIKEPRAVLFPALRAGRRLPVIAPEEAAFTPSDRRFNSLDIHLYWMLVTAPKMMDLSEGSSSNQCGGHGVGPEL